MKQDAGDGKMKEISDDIHDGALAFLNSEYKLLSIFVVVVSFTSRVQVLPKEDTFTDCDGIITIA